MTPAGLAIMICSLTAVIGLACFCIVRVLMLPAVDMEDLESPLTIDTSHPSHPKHSAADPQADS